MTHPIGEITCAGNVIYGCYRSTGKALSASSIRCGVQSASQNALLGNHLARCLLCDIGCNCAHLIHSSACKRCTAAGVLNRVSSLVHALYWHSRGNMD